MSSGSTTVSVAGGAPAKSGFNLLDSLLKAKKRKGVRQTSTAAAATATTATSAKRAKKSNGALTKTTPANGAVAAPPALGKRPKDLLVHDVADTSSAVPSAREASEQVFAVPGQEQADGGARSESLSNTFGIDTYELTQRYLVQTALRTAQVEAQGGQQETATERDTRNVQAASAQAQQRRPGVQAAATCNHMVRIMQGDMERDAQGLVVLPNSTPYAEEDMSAFASTFIANAIEQAPSFAAHEMLPSDEMRARSTAITYDYFVSFCRTAHPNEARCASGDACWGNNLYDARGTPLVKTTWRVFWFPQEYQRVQQNPAHYANEATFRYCIGCKFAKANNCVVNATLRNNRIRPEVLVCDAHVLVDINGEFPAEATRGRLTNGYNGLVLNLPIMSRVGWSVAPDQQRSGCYQYYSNIPRYPLGREYYERDSGPAANGASGAAGANPGF